MAAVLALNSLGLPSMTSYTILTPNVLADRDISEAAGIRGHFPWMMRGHGGPGGGASDPDPESFSNNWRRELLSGGIGICVRLDGAIRSSLVEIAIQCVVNPLGDKSQCRRRGYQQTTGYMLSRGAVLMPVIQRES